MSKGIIHSFESEPVRFRNSANNARNATHQLSPDRLRRGFSLE
jgi:hypothetical protein